MMEAEQAKKQTKLNQERMLIKGYHYSIKYLNREIQAAIDKGNSSIVIHTSGPGPEILLQPNDMCINDDVKKTVIYHYKKRGFKAYLHFKEGYQTERVISFPQEYIIIDWSDN